MNRRQAGTVSRKEVLRALCATGATVRHRGGEVIFDLHGRHFRLGCRNGVSPITLHRLEQRMVLAAYPVEAFRDHLFGSAKWKQKSVAVAR